MVRLRAIVLSLSAVTASALKCSPQLPIGGVSDHGARPAAAVRMVDGPPVDKSKAQEWYARPGSGAHALASS